MERSMLNSPPQVLDLCALSAWAQAGSTQVIKLLLASSDKHLVICSYALEAYVNSYLWLTYSYRFGLVGALLHV